MRRELKVAAVSGAIILGLLSTGPAQSLAATNSVVSGDIVDGEVKAVDIGTGAVQAAEIAANAVTGSRIVDGSIGNFDLGTNSVGSAKVINNSLTGADINEATLQGPKAHFAKIGYDGSLNGGDASSSVRESLGVYSINFPFTVTGCAVTANGEVGWGSGAVAYTGVWTSQQVRVYFSLGGNFVDVPFSLTMICP